MPYGKRAMVVTGRDKIRRAGMVADLEGAGFTCHLFGVPGEPTVEIAREGAESLRMFAPNVVIAIGGGSAIDAEAEAGAEWAWRLVQGLGIPQLRTYGIRQSDVEALVDKANNASSMKANPIQLNREELVRVLGSAV